MGQIKNRYKLLTAAILYSFNSLANPKQTYAAGCTYSWDDADNTGFGNYLSCIIQNTWSTISLLLVAFAIGLAGFLIFKTATQADNEKAWEELPKRWLYLFLLAFIAIGAGGTIINIMLNVLGVGDVDYWLIQLNNLLGNI
jgi:hypothetical protein